MFLPCGKKDIHIPECKGEDCDLGEKTITENGTYNAEDDNYDGYNQVTVNVPSQAPNLQEKSTNVNGIVLPDVGYDGLSKVIVDVTHGYKSPYAEGEGVFYLAALAAEEIQTLWYLNPDTQQMYSITIPNDDNILEWDSEVKTEGTEPTPRYTISVVASPSAGGSVSGGGQYWQDDSVTVRASTASGYSFSGWYRGETLVSSNTTYSFTATESVYLIAKFAEIQPVLVIYTEQGVGRIAEGTTGSLTMNLSHMPATGTNIIVVLRIGAEAVNYGTWTAGTAGSVTIDDITVSYNGVSSFVLDVAVAQSNITAINTITYSYYQ